MRENKIMVKVNLDALIPREDFAVKSDKTLPNMTDKFRIGDLIKGDSFVYPVLRKPDFQRETTDWDKVKIAEFIRSFLNGELIPAVILWQSGEYIFVIDGAHRLSALISWANDDYGDGDISQAFFNSDIDIEQKKQADLTRKYINKEIGSYRDYKEIANNPSLPIQDEKKLEYARKLGITSIQLQWVTGDAFKAENSFFTINQKASPINDTEIALLKARNKASALASRAIIRSGTGHNYWKSFDEQKQKDIQKIAKEINENLFTPVMQTPIKSLDLPLAGKVYSSNSLSLIFELVRLANNQINYKINNEVDDIDGSETYNYLKNTNKILRRMTTTHESSLGLHPAVYFYSEKGRYQPTALMAWIEIIKSWEMYHSHNIFNEFIKVRGLFEDFVIKNKSISNQLTVKYGSGLKGYKQLKEVYIFILDKFKQDLNLEEINSAIKSKFDYLILDVDNHNVNKEERSDFSRDTKSEIFLQSALASATKCSICGGYIHPKSMTIDHIKRKQDGGLGIAENGQLAHPYCNTTYKN